MAECGSDAADLPLLALGHDHLEDGLVALAIHHAHGAGGGLFAFDEQAARPALDRPGRWCTFDRHQIRLGMAKTRMRELIGKLAIVGQHHQAFAVRIQPADGEQMLGMRHQVEHRTALIAFVRLAGGEHVLRLVDGEIQLRQLIEAQLLAIHLDHVHIRVGLCPQCDDFAVNAHPALFDQLLCCAARGDIGHAQQFLNACFHPSIVFSLQSSITVLYAKASTARPDVFR